LNANIHFVGTTHVAGSLLPSYWPVLTLFVFVQYING